MSSLLLRAATHGVFRASRRIIKVSTRSSATLLYPPNHVSRLLLVDGYSHHRFLRAYSADARDGHPGTDVRRRRQTGTAHVDMVSNSENVEQQKLMALSALPTEDLRADDVEELAAYVLTAPSGTLQYTHYSNIIYAALRCPFERSDIIDDEDQTALPNNVHAPTSRMEEAEEGMSYADAFKNMQMEVEDGTDTHGGKGISHNVELAHVLMHHMVNDKIEPKADLYEMVMVAMMSKGVWGSLHSIPYIFRMIEKLGPGAPSARALDVGIQACHQCGQWLRALYLFSFMQLRDFIPSIESYGAAADCVVQDVQLEEKRHRSTTAGTADNQETEITFDGSASPQWIIDVADIFSASISHNVLSSWVMEEERDAQVVTLTLNAANAPPSLIAAGVFFVFRDKVRHYRHSQVRIVINSLKLDDVLTRIQTMMSLQGGTAYMNGVQLKKVNSNCLIIKDDRFQ